MTNAPASQHILAYDICVVTTHGDWRGRSVLLNTRQIFPLLINSPAGLQSPSLAKTAFNNIYKTVIHHLFGIDFGILSEKGF